MGELGCSGVHFGQGRANLVKLGGQQRHTRWPLGRLLSLCMMAVGVPRSGATPGSKNDEGELKSGVGMIAEGAEKVGKDAVIV